MGFVVNMDVILGGDDYLENTTFVIQRDRVRSVIGFEDDAYPYELMECDIENGYLACEVERWVLLIACPLLLAMSLIGNTLTLSVMMRPKLRSTATATFISALSIMDMIANMTGLSRHFILKAFRIDVRKLSGASCKIHRFVLYFSMDMSAWILGIVTIERFVAVCLPTKHRKIKTVSAALKILAALIVVQVAFNMQVFWTRGDHYQKVYDAVTKEELPLHCGYTSEEARYFWTHNQGALSMVWYCAIPFMTMLIFNILIIRRLRSLRDDSALSRGGSELSKTGITKQTNSMTRMLLSVTFYFLLVTVPILIFTMFQSVILYKDQYKDKKSGEKPDPEKLAQLELADAIMTTIVYINHSINFFLYCLTGRRFRRELRAMCGCMRTFNKKLSSIRQRSVKQSSKHYSSPGHRAMNGQDHAVAYNNVDAGDSAGSPMPSRKGHLIPSTYDTGQSTSVTHNVSGL